MLSDAFKAELDYLVQLCEELGTEEPALAPVLGRGADPGVSRLVEGLAFAFGRLRQRLDDDLPEVIDPVLDNLCPELLRPLPSATVMELTASPKMMSRHLVKAGSAFAARPVDGVGCTFRSVADCEVAPWRLAAVDISAPERRALRLRLELLDGAELGGALPRTLRLFFALPVAAALAARSFFLDATLSVVARSADDATATPVVLPPPVAVSFGAVAAGGATPLLAGAAAFLDLRDYFAFPQRFAFVEIPDVERLAELGEKTRSVELELTFREPLPRGLPLDIASIRLHAVPAVNVFRPPSPLNLPLSGGSRRCRLRFGDDSSATPRCTPSSMCGSSAAASKVPRRCRGPGSSSAVLARRRRRPERRRRASHPLRDRSRAVRDWCRARRKSPRSRRLASLPGSSTRCSPPRSRCSRRMARAPRRWGLATYASRRRHRRRSSRSATLRP